MKTHPNLLLTVITVLAGFSLTTGKAAVLPLIHGFEGIYSGWIPADPIIAAGPSSLVTMVSGKIAIHDKQGTKLFELNLGAGGFWAAQAGDQVFEPWVIFDPHSNRFIAIAREAGNISGNLYLAVSKTANPLSSSDWHKYGLDLTDIHVTTGESTFPGYPKVAVDSSAIYITANHFGINGGGFSHNKIIALDKTPVLSGGAVAIVHTESFTTLFGPLHPVMVFDVAAPMCFVTQDPNVDTVTVYALANVLTSPSLSASSVPVPAFDQPPNVPQLGSGELLDANGSRFMSGVVRNGSLWTAHAISDPSVDGEAVVRWYQFDVTGLPAFAATLVQNGNVDPGPGIHTWMTHINVDTSDNMGIGFSMSGPNQYAAIGYTGRRADDPAGTTLPVETARAGEGAYTAGNWGQYSGLAIDPDGSTFWLFHAYPTRTARKQTQPWRTFVGAFELVQPPPPSGPLHCGDLDGSSASSGKNSWKATVVITLHDVNHAPVPGATVSIQWSGGASGTASLTTDANGRCTFVSGNLAKTSPTATLTVTSVNHATLAYSSAANHDPDGDSNGTSISVNRP
jgi:hypothetical protein